MDQYALGWKPAWDQRIETRPSNRVARIIERHKHQYKGVTTEGAEINCYVRGKMMHSTISSSDYPAVGDWCIISDPYVDEANAPAATIVELLPRSSSISRIAAGTDSGSTWSEQVLVANVDFAFVVTSIDRDFNLNRLSRYIFSCRSGDVEPIVVLSKVDLLDAEWHSFRQELLNEYPEVRCIATSIISNEGIGVFEGILTAGKTGVFIGSSGVGKSSLVNALLSQERQLTMAINENITRGRHTTSASGLFFLPNGGMIIDTPGLRELHVIGTSDSLDQMMPSLVELAKDCYFRNCTHKSEPGCKVLSALEQGVLPEREFENYTKLEKELAYSRRKLDERFDSEERKRWKKIAMDNRKREKFRGD